MRRRHAPHMGRGSPLGKPPERLALAMEIAYRSAIKE
jgi:hypothetical protein